MALLSKDMRQEVERRVHAKYPEIEGGIPEHMREGKTPEGILEKPGDDDNAGAPPESKTRRFFVSPKHATPGSAPDASIEAAVENIEPRCVILDTDAHASVSEQEMRKAAIRSFLAEEKNDSEKTTVANATSREAVLLFSRPAWICRNSEIQNI